MYQTLARIIGTMVLTYLISHGYLTSPFVGTLTQDEVIDIGYGIIFVVFTLWAYLEKLINGHITVTGKTVIIPPLPTQPTPNLTNIPLNLDLKDK